MTTVLLPPSPNWYASHLADITMNTHAYCAHNSIVILDAAATRVCYVLKGHSNRTTAVAFVQDLQATCLWIISAAADKSVRLWTCTDFELKTFSCRRALGKRPAEVKAIAAASGAAVAILGDNAGNLFAWDVAASPEKMRRIEECKLSSSITCVVCSPRPGETIVAAGCSNGEIVFVDWEKNAVVGVVKQHKGEIQCLRWTHCGVEEESNKSELPPSQQAQHGSTVELLLSGAAGECFKVFELSAGNFAVCAGEICASFASSLPNSSTSAATAAATAESFSAQELLRHVSLVSTLDLPKAPANIGAGQRKRLWMAADWAPCPAVMQNRLNSLETWVVVGGYGGSLLARKVALPLHTSNGALKLDTNGSSARASSESYIRLSQGHSRSIFSVLCSWDMSKSSDHGGLRINTIGMDRSAMSFWAPMPRGTSTSDTAVAPDAEKKIWQRMEITGSLTGLGSFPHAMAMFPPTWRLNMDDDCQPRVALGCGDASLQILSLKSRLKGSGNPQAASSRPLNDCGVSFYVNNPATIQIWQGIPAAITAVSWHPDASDVIVFGCSDGSIGIADCKKGTAVLAPSKHKAAVSHLGWYCSGFSEDNSDLEETDSESGSDAHSGRVDGEDAFHLLSLSSDGSLLQWKAWSASTFSELFPAAKKNYGQASQQQKPVVRQELGKARAFPLYEALSVVPTCLDTTGFSDSTIGISDGRLLTIKDQGRLGRDIDAPQNSPKLILASATHVSITRTAIAAYYSDGRLRIAYNQNFIAFARTNDVFTQLNESAVVTSLAAKEFPRNVAEIAAGPGGASLDIPKVPTVYVAVGLQDGSIQIWTHVVRSNELKLEVVLRGHGGPVLSLLWMTVNKTSSTRRSFSTLYDHMVLFSGAEDQSVRTWDVEKLIIEEESRREERKESSQLAEEAEQEERKDAQSPSPAAAPPAPIKPTKMSQDKVTEEGDVAVNVNESSGAAEEEGPPPPPPPEELAKETAPTTSTSSSKPQASKPSISKKVSVSVPSLGSKGLLPSAPKRAETPEQQASLQAALLSMVSQDTATDPFADLGCIVDPVSATSSLQNASAALLSGPSQAPAAARLQAQRAAAVALWSGNISAALQVLVEHDALTADFVSCAAAAGRAAWEAAARCYAMVLEDRGELHLAVLHLLSIQDVSAACKVYSKAGMAREAASLAAARLPQNHSLVAETRAAFAAQLASRGEWERAAAQYVACKSWVEAIGALQSRGTATALLTGLHLLEMAQSDGSLAGILANELKSELQTGLNALGVDSTANLDAMLAELSLQSVGEGSKEHQRYSCEELNRLRQAVMNAQQESNIAKELNKKFPALLAK